MLFQNFHINNLFNIYLYIYVGDAESLSFGRFLNTWARGDITGRRT